MVRTKPCCGATAAHLRGSAYYSKPLFFLSETTKVVYGGRCRPRKCFTVISQRLGECDLYICLSGNSLCFLNCPAFIWCQGFFNTAVYHDIANDIFVFLFVICFEQHNFLHDHDSRWT